MVCFNTMDSDLYVKGCGIETCRSSVKIDPCVIKGYHICMVISGTGSMSVKGHTCRMEAGTVLVLPCGLEMELKAEPENPWKCAWVAIAGRNVQSCLKKLGFIHSPIRKNSCLVDHFVEIVARIQKTEEQTLANELRRNSCLYELLALLAETEAGIQKQRCDDSQDLYVKSAILYIHRNYSNIRVNDIASYIGISRSYLTTIFKNKMNVSPQEYLVNYRLNKAEQMLRTTDQSIQEIAGRVGYDNPLTFSKMFKNTFGVSPRYYRKGNQSMIS